jgi:hypothetical protein
MYPTTELYIPEDMCEILESHAVILFGGGRLF